MDKTTLFNLYLKEKKSVSQIAQIFNCSNSKINYWIFKYGITKREISDAVYARCNSKGDPFKFNAPQGPDDWFIYGLGIGLYWGEGNKSNKYSVRLGNTDPYLIKYFIVFLQKIFQINVDKLKFGLQLFNDSDSKKSINFWCKHLNINRNQFQKVVISKVRGVGSYKKKSEHGVLTIYFNNKKLRDLIVSQIEKMK